MLTENCIEKSSNWYFNIEYLEEANSLLSLPEEAIQAIKQAACKINSIKELRKLAGKHYSFLFYKSHGVNPINSKQYQIHELMGQCSDLFEAVVLISGLKNTLEIHKERGIDIHVTIDTLSDLRLWMEHYYKKYQTWGLKEANWLSNHFTGKLYRLGRLQFMMDSFMEQMELMLRKILGFLN